MKHYPALPHGEIEKIFENIFFVQGQVKMPMLMPMKISRSMTILRDESGDLTLVNSMRLNPDGLTKLEALGKVKNVLRIGGFHGRDDGFYREEYGANVFAIKGQPYTRKMGDSQDPNYLEPDQWLDESSMLPIPNARLHVIAGSPPEAILLLDQEGGIAVTADSLQNTPGPDQYVNFLASIMMKKFGFWKPYNVGPGWLQFASPSKEGVRSILNLNFEHVLPGHGSAVVGGAKEKFRPSIEGDLKGCHT